MGAMGVLLVAACASSPGPPSASSPSDAQSAGRDIHINPANIRRVGGELPPGYEVAVVPGPTSPAGIWGLGTGWTADPPLCAALADPAGADSVSSQGISGSGTGGIVYAVAVASTAHLVTLDRALVEKCGQWGMTNGSATASIRLVDPPHLDGIETVGMTGQIETFVEGGNEIDSRADTFIAYLGDGYVFTVLITDPGSPHPPLQPQAAVDLLMKTVSAVRS